MMELPDAPAREAILKDKLQQITPYLRTITIQPVVEQTEGFTGAILTHDAWLEESSPDAALLELLETVHAAGRAAMLG